MSLREIGGFLVLWGTGEIVSRARLKSGWTFKVRLG